MSTTNDSDGSFNTPSHSSKSENAEQDYLSSLKDTIAANRVAHREALEAERSACLRALLFKMVSDIIKFLDEYKTTVYPHARLSFVPVFVLPEHGPSKREELNEYPSRAKFERSKVLDAAELFWGQPYLAKLIVAFLKTTLESLLGNFARLEREKGVVVTVDAKHERRYVTSGSAKGCELEGCVLFVDVEMVGMR